MLNLLLSFRTTAWMEGDNGEVSSRGFVSFGNCIVCIVELLTSSYMHTHAHADRICT